MNNKNKIGLLGLCVCATLMSGFSASASAAKHGEGVPYEAAPRFYLEDMVVTATRTPLTEKSVPMVAKVITKTEIEEMGAMNVTDALKFIPGINLQNTTDHGGHSVKMRGMENYHTLILIDGRRMAGENNKKTMNKNMLERISVNDVDRIEVIFGSGSALYGSDALGGVINIITKTDYHSWTDSGVYTSGDQSGVSFAHTTGYTGKLRAKISGRVDRLREKENYRYFYPRYKKEIFGTNNYGFKRYLDLNLDYSMNDTHGLEFGANFVKEQLSQKKESRSSTFDENNNNRSDYSLRYYGEDGKHDYEIGAYTNIFNKKRYTNGVLKDSKREKFDIKRFEAHDTITLNDKHIMTVGGEVGSEYYKSTRLAEKDKSINTGAMYLEDQFQVNEDWLFIPAVRVDYHENYGHEFSPKIGTTYNLSENARIKANYGKGFRAPTISELYSEINHGSFMIYGNKDLEPEKSTNFDISLEGEKGKAFAKVTYFDNDVNNLIDYNSATDADGSWCLIMGNKGDYKIQGVEAELKYNFDEHWTLATSCNYLDAVDKESDEKLDERAKYSGQVRLTYHSGGNRALTLNLWNDWTSRFPADDEMYSFNTTSFVAHKKVSPVASIYVGVDNIFDKKYEQDANHSFVLDGRSWRVGLETRI